MSFIAHNFSPRHVQSGVSGSELLDSFSAPTQFTTLLKGEQVVDLNSLQDDAPRRQSEQSSPDQSTSDQSILGAAVPKVQHRREVESSSAVVSSRAIAARRLTRTIASDRVRARRG